MILSDAVTASLSPGAQKLVQTVLNGKNSASSEAAAGVNQWLVALLERHGPMAETLAASLDAATTLTYTRAQIAAGQAGQMIAPNALVEQALQRAKTRGKDVASEQDVAAIVLAAAGYMLSDTANVAAPSVSSNTAQELTFQQNAFQQNASAPAWKPKAKRPTPALARFGRDLTQAVMEGKLSVLVGREEETSLMVETLCRRTKRNPVLVGPAGVGKTAIVEGLARRVVSGNVPGLLQNARVFAIQPSTLIAGAGYGDLEKRMEAIVSEASQDGILLFIDEVHAIVGAGGRPGAGDMSSLLKPALARGEIACIAATTDDEYRRFIEEDPALERRFQPLRVHELSGAQTLAVLAALRDELHQANGVTVSDDALHDIVAFAERYMPNRHFPDKGVDLLEQAVAHALAGGQTEVTRADAMLVANRLVGMPLSGEGWQDALRLRLDSEGALPPEDTSVLINRLQVTLAGFDIHPARPNAIVLLTGEAAASGHNLADAIAQTIFGGEDRIVTLDFGRYTEPHHVSMLIGSPPGYVGYSEHLPIHEIARIPWCVLLCANIDACHPVVRDVMTQALGAGFLTDAQGKRLYLSDAVVILTTRESAAAERKMGIRVHDKALPGEQKEKQKETERQSAAQMVGSDLARLCDLISSRAPDARDHADSAHRRQEALLSELSQRYSRHGLSVQWNDSVYAWLDTHTRQAGADADWERLVDNDLSPLLVAQLTKRSAMEPISVLVEYKDNVLQVTPRDNAQEQQQERQTEEQRS